MKPGVAFLLGLVIGAVALWQVGDRRLTKWVAAAEIQQAQEKARVAEINERTVDGYAAAVAHLRDRLLAGERSRPPGMSSGRVPKPAGPVDGTAAESLDGARRAAADLGQQLADCNADYARIYDDAAMTTLQLVTLQHWIREATGNGQH